MFASRLAFTKTHGFLHGSAIKRYGVRAEASVRAVCVHRVLPAGGRVGKRIMRSLCTRYKMLAQATECKFGRSRAIGTPVASCYRRS